MASTIYLQTEILYKDLSLFQEEMSGYIMGLNHSQVRIYSSKPRKEFMVKKVYETFK